MRNDHDELLKLLNGSGFPFQIGVRKEIERTIADHGWEVNAEEHHWRHPESNSSGFADLVIGHKQFIFSAVMECKRIKEEGKWLFLTPRGYTAESRRISALCTQVPKNDEPPFLGWADFNFDPITPEAAYCVFLGQDEKKPMLERIADDLLPAVEGVGLEYVQLSKTDRGSQGEWRLFMPIIVTNAILFTGTFDADRVSMDNGRLAGDGCEFKSVPFVRFRKSLATHYPKVDQRHWMSNSFNRSSLAKETSVLVVHSAALANSLKQLNVPTNENTVFGHALENLNRSPL